jgi:chitodextrinase
MVWDALASYPSAGVAYTEFTDSVSAASGDPTLCPKTYTATISPSTLTTFSLDTTNKKFQIYSDAYSQIGSYTVTLVGALVEVPSVTKSTTFTITVVDPCPTTTLI